MVITRPPIPSTPRIAPPGEQRHQADQHQQPADDECEHGRAGDRPRPTGAARPAAGTPGLPVARVLLRVLLGRVLLGRVLLAGYC